MILCNIKYSEEKQKVAIAAMQEKFHDICKIFWEKIILQ